jgi:hypothetical protein
MRLGRRICLYSLVDGNTVLLLNQWVTAERDCS